MYIKTTPLLLNIIWNSKKAVGMLTSILFLFSSFLLLSTKSSLSQTIEFDFMFGSFGGGAGQFNSPDGIAVDSMKNIYVADSRNDRIQVFDSAGNFLFMFGWGVDDGTNEFQICTSAEIPCQPGINGSGSGQFNDPSGVALDSINNIYVADTHNGRIQVFDSAGNFLFMFGSELSGLFPDVALDSMNNTYVTDNSNQQIGVFNSAGIFQFVFGSTGDGAGQFTFPAGITIDSMNNVYVVAPSNQRIQVFDSAGNFQYMFGWGVDDGTNEFQICTSADIPCQGGINGNDAGQFSNPWRVAVDNMKNMYVADSNNRRIQVFDSAGNFQYMFGWGVDDGTNEFQICTSANILCQPGINGNGIGQFNFPVGIAVDSTKNIYVAEFSNHRIQVFSQSQEILPIENFSTPTLSRFGLIALAAILGIVGFTFIRRRKVAD